MKSRLRTIVSSPAVLLPLALLTGVAVGTYLPGSSSRRGPSITALPGTRTSNEWEYAVYSEGASSYVWQDGDRRVEAVSPDDFYQQMGFSPGSEGEAGPDRTLVTLNHLGERGWDLVQVQSDAYWFKRPR